MNDKRDPMKKSNISRLHIQIWCNVCRILNSLQLQIKNFQVLEEIPVSMQVFLLARIIAEKKSERIIPAEFDRYLRIAIFVF